MAQPPTPVHIMPHSPAHARRRSESHDRARKYPVLRIREKLTPANVVLEQRDGHVLSQNMMLKLDDWGHRREKDRIERAQEKITGAARKDHVVDIPVAGVSRWYQIQDVPVFGIGQATTNGIRTVLNILGASTSDEIHSPILRDGHGGGSPVNSVASPVHHTQHQQVVWVNLREEPLIFVNHRPFVLRDLNHPFREMVSFEGMDGQRIETIERRLKSDVLKEVPTYHSNLLVHDEVDHLEVFPFWESVTGDSVLTPREVFENLAKEEGYRVRYERLPLSSGHAATVHDIEALLQIINNHAFKGPTIFVFSSRGKGRAMGTMALTMLHLTRFGLVDLPRRVLFRKVVRQDIMNKLVGKPTLDKLVGLVKKGRRLEDPVKDDPRSLEIDYVVISKLLRLVRNGPKAKGMCDLVLTGFFGGAHDLRKMIVENHMSALSKQGEGEMRELYNEQAAALLRQYVHMICFQSFLDDLSLPAPNRPPKESFEVWVEKRPEINQLIKEQFAEHSTLFRRGTGNPESSPFEGLAPEMQLAMQARDGVLLSKQCIVLRDTIMDTDEEARDLVLLKLTASAGAAGAAAAAFAGIASSLITAQPALAAVAAAAAAAAAAGAKRSSLELPQGSPSHSEVPKESSPKEVTNGGEPAQLQSDSTVAVAAVAAEQKAVAEGDDGVLIEVDPKVSGDENGGVPSGTPRAARLSVTVQAHNSSEPQLLSPQSPPLPALTAQPGPADPTAQLSPDAQHGHGMHGTRPPAIHVPSPRATITAPGPGGKPPPTPAPVVAEGLGAPGIDMSVHAPNFQNLGLVSTTAQPTLHGIRAILDQVNAKHSMVMWVDLRQEPLVYINGRPFALREGSNPLNPLSEFNASLTAQKVEQIGERFKKEVLQQMETTGEGKLRIVAHRKVRRTLDANEDEASDAEDDESMQSVHAEELGEGNNQRNGHIDFVSEAYWQEIDSRFNVLTTRELFMQLRREGYRVRYIHAPFSHIETNVDFFDRLLSGASRAGLTKATSHVVCSSEGGRSRVGLMSVLYLILFMMRNGVTAVPGLAESLNQVAHGKNGTLNLTRAKQAHQGGHSVRRERLLRGDYKCVLELVRVLKHGLTIRHQVDSLVDICGRFFHIRHAILSQLEMAERERNEDRRTTLILRGKVLLQRYMYLMCYLAFLADARPQVLDDAASYDADHPLESPAVFDSPPPLLQQMSLNTLGHHHSFASWLAQIPEVMSVLEKFNENPDRSLKLQGLAVQESSDEGAVEVLENRRGKVLIGWCMLKPDHFPGLHRRDLEPALEGAPNFRQIANLPVCGVAIPSVPGMVTLLKYVSEHESTKKYCHHVTWINLREEPVIYLRAVPFVFRDIDTPWRNVVYTGISAERLEEMERQLKADVLAESERYNNQILCHDELTPGKLTGYWEVLATSSSVQTTAEAYMAAFQRARTELNVVAVRARVPITDEQAPELPDLDDIVDIMQKAPEESLFVFNCQQGRGRTTTGTVIATLWYLTQQKNKGTFHEPVVPKKVLKKVNEIAGHVTHGGHGHGHGAPGKLENMDHRAFADLERGNFEVIKKLVRALDEGPAAKAMCDRVIDICSSMANLREQIVEFKIKSESALKASSARENKEKGAWALERYYYLIAFAAYLHQHPRPVHATLASPASGPSFVDWFNQQSELVKMVPECKNL